MSYELFQQGPTAYVPVIFVSLIITLVAYCAFPLIFSKFRKKIITKRKYKLLCYFVNFVVMVLFIVINGEPSSGGPYILWTLVFSAAGIKTLKNRGILEGFQISIDPSSSTPFTDNDYSTGESGISNVEVPESAAPKHSENQEKSLFLRAYNSYLSDDPKERLFFEELLGTEELKAAYLEERAKNNDDYDNGLRISYRESYTSFMSALHDEYFKRPMSQSPISEMPDEKPVEKIKIDRVQTKHKDNNKRYCKFCGQIIDTSTKKCTGCGKQYFNAKFKPLHIVIVVLFMLIGYVGVNYFCAVSAMNNQEFIKSQQFFDNMFVSETVFPEKHAYIEAGVLMEEGKYVEALNAFNKVDNVPVPATITDSLKSKIYSDGQAAYKSENLTEAKKNFIALGDYKRSADYLLLISCSGSVNSFLVGQPPKSITVN